MLMLNRDGNHQTPCDIILSQYFTHNMILWFLTYIIYVLLELLEQYYQCSDNTHFNLSPFLTANYVLKINLCQIFVLFSKIKLSQLFFCCTIRLSILGTLSLKLAINLVITWSQSAISLISVCDWLGSNWQFHTIYLW